MSESITDPSDWPIEFKSLREIDSNLRCPICKELVRAAIILQCSHNFCSECIRRHLDKESSCPACRVPTSTSQMRRNVALDEIANSFGDCRSLLLSTLNDAVKPKQSKAYVPRLITEDSMDIDYDSPQQKRRRTSTRITNKPISSSQDHVDFSMSQASLHDDKDEDFVLNHQDSSQLRHKGKSSSRCTGPVLRSRGGRVEQTLPQSSQPSQEISTNHNSAQIPIANHHHTPVTTLVSAPTPSPSSSISNTSELGLPTNGDKTLMQKRHAEYTTIFNANCDSTRPKSIAELKKLMQAWEKAYEQDLEAKEQQRKIHEQQQQNQRQIHAKKKAEKAAAAADALDSESIDASSATPPSSQSSLGRSGSSTFIPNQANNDAINVAVATASATAHVVKYADEYAELIADVRRRLKADKENAHAEEAVATASQSSL
ncbi:E3 ubiquitin-protein ligase rad18 [Linnemannia zychae]|nr:E3 ubiquitin-protein ligase rad18 [Linnemannia zychae]